MTDVGSERPQSYLSLIRLARHLTNYVTYYGVEANARNALEQIEAMAPCVVQMDEIEKGFGIVGGDGDSGAGMRAFGTVLKWMSERSCPAFIIMTANDVSRLPPEFTR